MKTILENPWVRSLTITCMALSILMTTGCGGCGKKTAKDAAAEEKQKAEAKKKKEPFETNTPVLLPGYFPKTKKEKERELQNIKENPLAEAMQEVRSKVLKNRVKPGHWYTANFPAIANNFNSKGELTAYSANTQSKPVRIPSTDYFLSTTRPVSLPRGEWKNLETSVYIPIRASKMSTASVSYSLNQSANGLAQIMETQLTSTLKPHQYHIVLMSSRPDSYAFLNLADSIAVRGTLNDFSMIPPFHYIVPTMSEKPIPLPQHSLNWTTIAYLIWDDYDPEQLGAEHQQAILDWLHFGGQLIISGPDCLDQLQTSFLAEYLPAHFDGSRNLSNSDVKELNNNWTISATRNESEKRTLQISNKVPLLGVTFKPHDDAKFITGTGEIAIERRIGRGRIAVTAFSLNAPSVRKWPSFKSFLNGALLRKPARNFGRSDSGDTLFEWVDDGTDLFDPMIHSTLRFLSRDLSPSGNGTELESTPLVVDAGDDSRPRSLYGGEDGTDTKIANSHNRTHQRNLNDAWHYGGFQDTPVSGTGGWNDNSGISLAARGTLKEAAGITPPSSSFVLKMLGVYLLVLVPLNWFVFRMIGKVEYAWVAAPIIAIVGAILVVKLAALDIGFVRSNTQVGLLEIHAGYSRAHLAEYSALYTSLSTSYDAELDNLSAQSMPFGTKNPDELFEPKESMSEVKLRRTMESTLEGFQIKSNTTGLLHTEYMLDLAGVIFFVPPTPSSSARVVNSTNLDLVHSAIIRRDKNDNYQIAWIGELAASTDTELNFKSLPYEEIKQNWDDLPTFLNTKKMAVRIWLDNVGGPEPTPLENIEAFPELQNQLPKFLSLLLRQTPDTEEGYTYDQFVDAYESAFSLKNVSLGRMLDSVLQNLTLSQGESRLIGATSQRLGATKFDPESTQTDQQTLVVAHLQMPDLPLAKRDLNGSEDFTRVRSNLDWDDDDELKDLLADEQAEPADAQKQKQP
ncbi:MAG: hypothetical protein ACI87E_002117 [Mariniblastus sp.]|jgi:hypothetical protein